MKRLFDRFLDRLSDEGWSYGYCWYVNLETGQRFWQLDARRGEETKIWRVKEEDFAGIIIQAIRCELPRFGGHIEKIGFYFSWEDVSE